MKIFYRAALAAALILATGTATTPAAAAQHGTRLLVRPGQSIQAALDAARPGDTVLVLAGVYRENLEITTDHVTLRGAGARLEPPATPTPRRCSTFFGIPDNPYGICIAGDRDPATGAVTRQIHGVTVQGFTISEFPDIGIFTFGGSDTLIQRNDIAGGKGDSGYSVLLLRSSGSRILFNRVHGAGGAGIYIGSSPDARTVIANNVANNSGSFGIMVRDSVGGTVENNITYDNCMGIGFVDGISTGTAASWTAHHNLVQHNTNVCPGEPDVSGVGILLAGAHNITLEHNLVLHNTPNSTNIPYSGGIVLASGSIFGGTELATANHITHNTILGNTPTDLNIVQANPPNQITHNLCHTSTPTGLCRQDTTRLVTARPIDR